MIALRRSIGRSIGRSTGRMEGVPEAWLCAYGRPPHSAKVGGERGVCYGWPSWWSIGTREGGGSSWGCSGQEHGHEAMRAQGAYGKGWCGAKGMDAIVQMLCCPASCCNVARCNERAQRSVYMQNAQPLVSLCVYDGSTDSLCRKWDRTEPLVCCRCVCCTIFIHFIHS